MRNGIKNGLMKESVGGNDKGVDKSKLEIIDVDKEDLSHYSKKTVDIMSEFPHGLEELEGIANRTDFDIGSSKNQKILK